MRNPKIFHKREAAAKREYGDGYTPVTVVSWKGNKPVDSTPMFCETGFMKRLSIDPKFIQEEKIGSSRVTLTLPSPWAIFPFVEIREEGKPPEYRIHQALLSENSSFQMAKDDFMRIVDDFKEKHEREAGGPMQRMKTQEQMFRDEQQKMGEVNRLFMDLVDDGMTRDELTKNISRRPELWGRFENWLDKLPVSREDNSFQMGQEKARRIVDDEEEETPSPGL